VAFLRARLDEDEAVAVRTVNAGRLFREIAAQRAILDEHMPVIPDYGPSRGERCCGTCGAVGDDAYLAVSWPCDTIRHLLAVYSDHPDYRQEWAP